MKRKYFNNKIDRSNEEIILQLYNCFNSLVSDATEYDNGNFQAIRRSSAILRMLFYDSKTSHSILSQISDKKRFKILNTFIIENNIKGYFGGVLFVQLIGSPLQPKQIYNTFVPDNLLEINPKKEILFENWWNGSVFLLGDYEKMTRKDFITIMANQDGGAHVDPQVNETYLGIARGDVGWRVSLSDFVPKELYDTMHPDKDGYIHPKDMQLAIMRKIVHEVLYSLPKQLKLKIKYKPNFNKNLNRRINGIAFNIVFGNKN